jgi:uncharacterized protein YjbI with pentapeptide repeats
MSKKQAAQTEEPRTKWRRWRPTRSQVLWVVGMVAALVALAVLVVQLYPGIWQHVSTQPLAVFKGRLVTLVGIAVALTVVIVLLALGGAALGWTGFGEKKLWNWLELLGTLAIPVVVAVATAWLTSQQSATQTQIEEQRAQNAALQAYLDQMSSLLLEKDLRASEEDSEVRTLARARTLTVLDRMDPSHKIEVMRFLMEASLVQVEKCCKEPVIDLNRAPLSDLNLLYARLERAHLNSADLSSANLRSAELAYAHLEDARLSGADLSGADLSGADMDYADLSHANLGGAHLSNADLSGADLSDAYLSNADLSGADLSKADLSDAYLSNAYLSNADLRSADLHSAKGVTKERLEAQARTLSSATMPDGQKMPLEPELLKAGPIQPREYLTAKFEPAFRYEVGEGWDALDQERAHWLAIRNSERGQLTFTSPLHVFDPSNPSKLKEVPAPQGVDKWVSWFQSHPNLETSEPVPVSVGGASGIQIDVTTTSAPENYPQEKCPGCVFLYPASEKPIGTIKGSKDRFVILDVGGKTVLIDIFAPADKLEDFAPVAQKVLVTVEWDGA